MGARDGKAFASDGRRLIAPEEMKGCYFGHGGICFPCAGWNYYKLVPKGRDAYRKDGFCCCCLPLPFCFEVWRRKDPDTNVFVPQMRIGLLEKHKYVRHGRIEHTLGACCWSETRRN